MLASSLTEFKLTKIDDRLGFVLMSDRIGVIVKALDPRRTKDGRDHDLVSAYFGFESGPAAQAFADWVERRHPNDRRYLPLTTVRRGDRLSCPFEVKVRSMPGLTALIQGALEKQRREIDRNVDRYNAMVKKPSDRVLVGSGDRVVGID